MTAGWAQVGYICMQAVPIFFVLASGKRGYALATALWALGNIVAYLSK